MSVNSKSIRFIALFLAVLMLGEHPVYVLADGIRPSGMSESFSLSNIADDLTRGRFQKSLLSGNGAVKRFVPAGPKLVFLIEDPHANLGGQKNLAELIRRISTRYGIHEVFVEGGSGDVTPTPLKEIGSQKIWSQIAEHELVRGNISGEEYLSLASNLPLKLTGAEDVDLYRRGVELYRDVYRSRENDLKRIHRIRRVVQRLKNVIYPKELLEFENSLDAVNAKSSPIQEAEILIRMLQGDMVRYPALSEMLQIQKSESRTDFQKAQYQFGALSSRLGMSPADLASSTDEVKSAMISEMLLSAEEKSIPEFEYDALRNYLETFNRFKAMDPEKVLLEIELLRSEIYQQMLKTEDAKKIFAVSRLIDLFENGSRIMLQRVEYREWIRRTSAAPETGWIAYLNRKLLENGFAEDLIESENLWNDSADRIRGFYENAIDREKFLAQNLQNRFQQSEQRAVFLITGGFHTDPVVSLLEKSGYSVMVLTPRVESETNRSVYEKILLSEDFASDESGDLNPNTIRAVSLMESPSRRSQLVLTAARLSDIPENRIEEYFDPLNKNASSQSLSGGGASASRLSDSETQSEAVTVNGHQIGITLKKDAIPGKIGIEPASIDFSVDGVPIISFFVDRPAPETSADTMRNLVKTLSLNPQLFDGWPQADHYQLQKNIKSLFDTEMDVVEFTASPDQKIEYDEVQAYTEYIYDRIRTHLFSSQIIPESGREAVEKELKLIVEESIKNSYEAIQVKSMFMAGANPEAGYQPDPDPEYENKEFTGQILLLLTPQGNEYVFQIIDNGTGIKDEVARFTEKEVERENEIADWLAGWMERWEGPGHQSTFKRAHREAFLNLSGQGQGLLMIEHFSHSDRIKGTWSLRNRTQGWDHKQGAIFTYRFSVAPVTGSRLSQKAMYYFDQALGGLLFFGKSILVFPIASKLMTGAWSFNFLDIIFGVWAVTVSSILKHHVYLNFLKHKDNAGPGEYDIRTFIRDSHPWVMGLGGLSLAFLSAYIPGVALPYLGYNPQIWNPGIKSGLILMTLGIGSGLVKSESKSRYRYDSGQDLFHESLREYENIADLLLNLAQDDPEMARNISITLDSENTHNFQNYKTYLDFNLKKLSVISENILKTDKIDWDADIPDSPDENDVSAAAYISFKEKLLFFESVAALDEIIANLGSHEFFTKSRKDLITAARYNFGRRFSAQAEAFFDQAIDAREYRGFGIIESAFNESQLLDRDEEALRNLKEDVSRGLPNYFTAGSRLAVDPLQPQKNSETSLGKELRKAVLNGSASAVALAAAGYGVYGYYAEVLGVISGGVILTAGALFSAVFAWRAFKAGYLNPLRARHKLSESEFDERLTEAVLMLIRRSAISLYQKYSRRIVSLRNRGSLAVLDPQSESFDVRLWRKYALSNSYFKEHATAFFKGKRYSGSDLQSWVDREIKPIDPDFSITDLVKPEDIVSYEQYTYFVQLIDSKVLIPRGVAVIDNGLSPIFSRIVNEEKVTTPLGREVSVYTIEPENKKLMTQSGYADMEGNIFIRADAAAEEYKTNSEWHQRFMNERVNPSRKNLDEGEKQLKKIQSQIKKKISAAEKAELTGIAAALEAEIKQGRAEIESEITEPKTVLWSAVVAGRPEKQALSDLRNSTLLEEISHSDTAYINRMILGHPLHHDHLANNPEELGFFLKTLIKPDSFLWEIFDAENGVPMADAVHGVIEFEGRLKAASQNFAPLILIDRSEKDISERIALASTIRSIVDQIAPGTSESDWPAEYDKYLRSRMKNFKKFAQTFRNLAAEAYQRHFYSYEERQQIAQKIQNAGSESADPGARLASPGSGHEIVPTIGQILFTHFISKDGSRHYSIGSPLDGEINYFSFRQNAGNFLNLRRLDQTEDWIGKYDAGEIRFPLVFKPIYGALGQMLLFAEDSQDGGTRLITDASLAGEAAYFFAQLPNFRFDASRYLYSAQFSSNYPEIIPELWDAFTETFGDPGMVEERPDVIHINRSDDPENPRFRTYEIRRNAIVNFETGEVDFLYDWDIAKIGANEYLANQYGHSEAMRMTSGIYDPLYAVFPELLSNETGYEQSIDTKIKQHVRHLIQKLADEQGLRLDIKLHAQFDIQFRRDYWGEVVPFLIEQDFIAPSHAFLKPATVLKNASGDLNDAAADGSGARLSEAQNTVLGFITPDLSLDRDRFGGEKNVDLKDAVLDALESAGFHPFFILTGSAAYTAKEGEKINWNLVDDLDLVVHWSSGETSISVFDAMSAFEDNLFDRLSESGIQIERPLFLKDSQSGREIKIQILFSDLKSSLYGSSLQSGNSRMKSFSSDVIFVMRDSEKAFVDQLLAGREKNTVQTLRKFSAQLEDVFDRYIEFAESGQQRDFEVWRKFLKRIYRQVKIIALTANPDAVEWLVTAESLFESSEFSLRSDSALDEIDEAVRSGAVIIQENAAGDLKKGIEIQLDSYLPGARLADGEKADGASSELNVFHQRFLNATGFENLPLLYKNPYRIVSGERFRGVSLTVSDDTLKFGEAVHTPNAGVYAASSGDLDVFMVREGESVFVTNLNDNETIFTDRLLTCVACGVRAVLKNGAVEYGLGHFRNIHLPISGEYEDRIFQSDFEAFFELLGDPALYLNLHFALMRLTGIYSREKILEEREQELKQQISVLYEKARITETIAPTAEGSHGNFGLTRKGWFLSYNKPFDDISVRITGEALWSDAGGARLADDVYDARMNRLLRRYRNDYDLQIWTNQNAREIPIGENNVFILPHYITAQVSAIQHIAPILNFGDEVDLLNVPVDSLIHLTDADHDSFIGTAELRTCVGCGYYATTPYESLLDLSHLFINSDRNTIHDFKRGFDQFKEYAPDPELVEKMDFVIAFSASREYWGIGMRKFMIEAIIGDLQTTYPTANFHLFGIDNDVSYDIRMILNPGGFGIDWVTPGVKERAYVLQPFDESERASRLSDAIEFINTPADVFEFTAGEKLLLIKVGESGNRLKLGVFPVLFSRGILYLRAQLKNVREIRLTLSGASVEGGEFSLDALDSADIQAETADERLTQVPEENSAVESESIFADLVLDRLLIRPDRNLQAEQSVGITMRLNDFSVGKSSADRQYFARQLRILKSQLSHLKKRAGVQVFLNFGDSDPDLISIAREEGIYQREFLPGMKRITLTAVESLDKTGTAGSGFFPVQSAHKEDGAYPAFPVRGTVLLAVWLGLTDEEIRFDDPIIPALKQLAGTNDADLNSDYLNGIREGRTDLDTLSRAKRFAVGARKFFDLNTWMSFARKSLAAIAISA